MFLLNSHYKTSIANLLSTSRLFHTSYMGTQNSGKETRDRSKKLSTDIGSYHIDFNFDTVVTALMNLFTVVTNFQPRFKVHGGGKAENAALHNVQARLRMVLSYLFASLLPTVRQRPGGGGLLVLASSNVDGMFLSKPFFMNRLLTEL